MFEMFEIGKIKFYNITTRNLWKNHKRIVV